MIRSFLFAWILGLFTIVPYGIYYLLFEASRDQYALIGVGVLFWVFGYWGVIGPIISALKVYRVLKSLENIKSKEELIALVNNQESREVAIELIASENKIPKFIAKRILAKLESSYSR